MRPVDLLKLVPAAALQDALVDGGLCADADVLDVRPARQLDLLHDLVLQGRVKAQVGLLEAASVNVSGPVLRETVQQRAHATGQAVDDLQRNVRAEVLDLCGPLHQEGSTDYEPRGFLLVEVMQTVKLLKLVPAAAHQEALIDGGLLVDADVLDVRLARQLDPLPDLVLQGLVQARVELLEAATVPVRGPMLRGTVQQKAQGTGQALDDRQGRDRNRVLDLCSPHLAGKASTDNERRGFLLVEAVRLVELLKLVPAAAPQVALVDVRPNIDRLSLLIDSGKPQRLAHVLEGPAVAASMGDAVVKPDILRSVQEDRLHHS